MRRTVLCLSSDPPPLPGHPVSGGGLRIGTLARGLAAYGHRVQHAVDARALPEGAPPALRDLAFLPGDLLRVVARVDPDVLLVEQWALAGFLEGVDLPVIVDLHGSLALENLYRRPEARLASDFAAKAEALARADHVLVPGQRQRDWFAAFQLLAGWAPDQLGATLVPLSIADPVPERTVTGGPLRLVYGGARWPWIDSGTALIAAAAAVEGRSDARLDVYLSTPSASLLGDVDGAHSPWERVDDALSGRAQAAVHAAVPHAAWRELLAGQATVALDVHADNPERRLAMTTRTIEYLWAGLPVIYSRHGELAQELEASQAGWLVDPQDGRAVAELVLELAEHPRHVQARARNARRLFHDRHTAESACQPLARLVEDLRVRPRRPSLLRDMSEARVATVHRELDEVRRQSAERSALVEREWTQERLDYKARLQASSEDLRLAVAERDRVAALAEDDLRALRADRERLVAQHADDERAARARVDQLSAQMQDLDTSTRQRIQAQEQTLVDALARLDGVREERQALKEQLAAVQDELEKRRSEVKGLAEAHDALRLELEGARVHGEGLHQKAEGLEAERDGLLAERAGLHEQAAALTRERDEALGRAEVMRVHAANVERTLGELRATPAWKQVARNARDRARGHRPGPPPAAGEPGDGPPYGSGADPEPTPERPPEPVPMSGPGAAQVVHPRQHARGVLGRVRSAPDFIRLWVSEVEGKL